MQEYALISVGDAHERGNVVRGQSFQIAQDHNLALALGKLRQKLLNASGEVLGDEAVIGAVGPRLGRCNPRSGSVEALVDPWFGPAGAHLAASCRSGAVEQNVKQPGLEGRASFEPLDATYDCEPGVLGDLFGYGATADSHLGEAHHALLVSLDERDEG
jgi:hypothetical protein